MGRAPCCDKNGLKKGPWTPEEDQKLMDYIQKNGQGSWRTLPKNAGLARCGKSCRLRWTNYLRPDIKRGRFSFEEEETIIQLHSIMGNKWSAIAARLPGRTDNEIKNYWNTHIRKRLLRMGIDPITHKPRLNNLLDLSLLLGPSLYNPAQFDLSKLVDLEPLLNSEILRLTTSLLSSQSSDISKQNLQGQQFLSPEIQEQFASFQALQMNPTQEVSPRLATSNTQILDETHLMMQPNEGREQLISQTNLWHEIASQANLSESSIPMTSWLSYESIDPAIPPLISEPSEFYDVNNQNCNLASVVSPTASSPATLNNSSSTTNMNSSIEDERESYCNHLFRFQVPDFFDVNDCL